MKITANMVTLTRIILMPIPGLLLYRESTALAVALVMIVVLGLTDWLDGILARREGPSVLGGLLDPIADKIFIAMIYLPLADVGIIPIWVTVCIFVRDFLVTSLRTTLSLRSAPMRTSTLAKHKTAIQMTGIGYVVLFLCLKNVPETPLLWAWMFSPIVLPLGLIVYRLVKRIKQGMRSWSMVFWLSVAFTIRYNSTPEGAIGIFIYIIGALTVYSGISYLVDAWGALKGSKGIFRELIRFVAEGVLVPALYISLLGQGYHGIVSAAIITIVALELCMGGLGNLLASQKNTVRLDIAAAKLSVQVVLGFVAFFGSSVQSTALGLALSEWVVLFATILTVAYTVVSFWRHRQAYLTAI